MMLGTDIRCGVPPWVPTILQAVGGDSSADQGEQSEKAFHVTEALHKCQRGLNAGSEERDLFEGTKREKPEEP